MQHSLVWQECIDVAEEVGGTSGLFSESLGFKPDADWQDFRCLSKPLLENDGTVP